MLKKQLGSAAHSTQVLSVLALLVESGMAYSMFWVSSIPEKIILHCLGNSPLAATDLCAGRDALRTGCGRLERANLCRDLHDRMHRTPCGEHLH